MDKAVKNQYGYGFEPAGALEDTREESTEKNFFSVPCHADMENAGFFKPGDFLG